MARARSVGIWDLGSCGSVQRKGRSLAYRGVGLARPAWSWGSLAGVVTGGPLVVALADAGLLQQPDRGAWEPRVAVAELEDSRAGDVEELSEPVDADEG